MTTPSKMRVLAALAKISPKGKSARDLRVEIVHIALDDDLSVHEAAELADAVEARTGVTIHRK